MKISFDKYQELKADLAFYYERLNVHYDNQEKREFWESKIENVKEILKTAIIED